VQDSIAALKHLIIERTEGNPFFMEEMVQALFEQGVLVRNGAAKLAKPLDQIRIPPTVQAILASRIDRLPAPEKELLQTLAVLGREFSVGLIKHVAAKPDDELERMLSDLQLAEFIYEQPAIPDIEYIFKHALTQEVAYDSVLAQRRRVLHQRAGETIESIFAERLEDHLSELAHHFDRGGNPPKALEYLTRAGQRAAQQSAHPEAIGHFTKALELLNSLPAGVDRDRQELALQMSLAQSLLIASGPGAPKRETALMRAQHLCESVGDNAHLMEALLALCSCHLSQRRFTAVQQLSRQALALAEQAKAPAIIGGAHCQLGTILFMCGQFEEARQHCDRAVELVGPPPFRTFAEFEYATRGAGVLAAALLMLGYPATALRKAGDSIAAAERLSDPFQLMYALFISFMVYFNVRDTATVIQRAEELVSLTTEHGMAGYLYQAVFFRGWGMAAVGKADEGIAEMRRALADAKASAGSPAFPPMLTGLAEACAKSGRAAEGLAAVEEGLRNADATGERSLDGDLHRIKGELLLVRAGSEVAAEACFRAAIDVARHQVARLFELRATTSLARLLKRQGKIDEARQMLSEIYNWFTEGFDTTDLKDAKALLEELAQ
jgi:adenylate cyclase